MASERETFIHADRELRQVIDRIESEQWAMQMPAFSLDQRSYTLREIINYQAYDEAWVPAMMEGRRMDDVGTEAFGEPFSGDLLGDQPKARFAELSDAAIEAVEGVPGEELDRRTVHFSYGDFSAREALRHIASFRGLRVYDLSTALGLDVRMSDELVAGLWDMLEPRIDEYRAFGVFPGPVEVADDAPLHDRLLGLTGRRL